MQATYTALQLQPLTCAHPTRHIRRWMGWGRGGLTLAQWPSRTLRRVAPLPVWLALVVLLGICVAGSPASPAIPASAASQQAPRSVPLSYGFQGDFFQSSTRARAIRAITDAGFGWAKQQVQWADYEVRSGDCATITDGCVVWSSGGRTKYFRKQQLSFLDAIVDDLQGAGLHVLLSVVRAPSFAAAPNSHSPADPQDLGDFVRFLASRYGGKVQAIEPWNEQNLSWEWGSARLWPNAPAAPPQGAVDFVALQKAAYRGIKAGDPNITVVLPALTPTGLGECWLDPAARTQSACLDQVRLAIDDRLYLDFLFQVNDGEIRSYYDVLGVHPSGYNNPPDDWVDSHTVSSTTFKGHPSFYIRRFQQLRDVQVSHGDSKPMWFTEVGWSVSPNPAPGYEYAGDNTEDVRARYVARLLEQVEHEAPYVTNLFLWNLNFRTIVPESDEKYGFGLLNPDGSGTPAYRCAADFVSSGNRISLPECGSAAARSEAPAAIMTLAPTATNTSQPTATPTASPTHTPSATSTPTRAPAETETASATTAPAATDTATPPASPTATPTAALGASASLAAPSATAPPVASAPGSPASPSTMAPTVTTAFEPSATAGPAPSPAPIAGEGRLQHVVAKGDTLYSLARRNQTTVDALVAANGLGSSGAVLPIGRVLTVPAPSDMELAPVAATPRPLHVVVKGDTLYSLARRNQTTVESLVSANALGSVDAILPIGLALVIP